MSFTICFMNICEYGPSYLHLVFQFYLCYSEDVFVVLENQQGMQINHC